MIAKIAFAAMLVISIAVVVPGEVSACQPTSWKCPLNGQFYSSCGPVPTPFLVQCAADVVEDRVPSVLA